MSDYYSSLRQYPSIQRLKNGESPNGPNGHSASNGLNGNTSAAQDGSGYVKVVEVRASTPVQSGQTQDFSDFDSRPAHQQADGNAIHVYDHATIQNGQNPHIVSNGSLRSPSVLSQSIRSSSRNGNYPVRGSSRRHFVEATPSISGHSVASSRDSYETSVTATLPALQTKGFVEEGDHLEPLMEDDPRSFDLVAPPTEQKNVYSLETRSEQLFSREHLRVIFADSPMLLKFTAFLSTHRPSSMAMLIYYLDATKALKAIAYANAIAEALEPIRGHEFTASAARPTINSTLLDKANQAFDILVREDLPAYVTHLYIRIVSESISKRVTGTLPPHLREASEGLAEVFCLTDPSRPDNPIVFASDEFHRTTQYGMNYVIGRNCRFLQGPRTNPFSVKRIRDSVQSGKEHCEVFLNYRRDGSPFLNLLMTAPLTDSRGQIRYFIGAQVDVSGLIKECTDLESLGRLVEKQQHDTDETLSDIDDESEDKDEFHELSEMLNMQELETVRRFGGRMHREHVDDNSDKNSISGWHRPRLLLKEPTQNTPKAYPGEAPRLSGKLSGVYQHYLLVRPFPSFRILFASPSLRMPGILQSPFMDRIGGSSRVREDLTHALAEGRGVTAKVRWVSKSDEEGRNRWIHCTPLLGSNQQIGVWMIVLVDDENEPVRRKWRQAPPVNPSVNSPNKAQGAFEVNNHDDSRYDTINAYNDRTQSLNSTSSPYSVAL